MTLSVRFLISPNGVCQHPSGRGYVANGNGICDIPINDAESIHTYLPRSHPDPDPTGVHRAQRLTVVGATADRPTNDPNRENWPPATMYDTTLAAQIYLVPGSNPASWVDITGSAV